jgi:hypothetical protein
MTILSRRFVTFAAVNTLVLASLALGLAPAGGAPPGPAGLKAPLGAAHAKTPKPLVYGGGKLLVSSVTYAIYWGPSANFPSDLQTGMTALLSGFSGSTYLATANQYFGATATTSFAGSYFDGSAPPRSAPNTSAVVSEVAKVLAANSLTPDPNAVYLLYTSNLPKINYCAWHSSGTIGSTTVQVAYLPNTANTTGCYPTGNYFGGLTNWSYGTRSIADNTAHEFMESITDPVPTTGWADGSGQEIGDKCNFNYLAPVTLSTNTVWQIQSMWSDAAGACVQTTPSS